MIVLPIGTLIPIPAQKIGQFGLHQLGQILSYVFVYRVSYHLKKAVGVLADLIDQFNGFCYGDFHLHGCFFLFGGLWQNPYIGKALFFRAFMNSHSRYYTTEAKHPAKILRPDYLKKLMP